MKKIYFDTEFTGLHQNTTLLSLALVADTGEEFYAEFTDYDKSQSSPWLQEQVICNLFLDKKNLSYTNHKMHLIGNKDAIKCALQIWINQFGVQKNEKDEIIPSIQIWADVPHYDWVLFCELFGGAFGIPKQIHYMPMDAATLLNIQNIDINIVRTTLIDTEKLPQSLKQHNALYDAYTVKLLVEKYHK